MTAALLALALAGPSTLDAPIMSEQDTTPHAATGAPGATMPAKGEEVAVLTTDKGTIILKFFPNVAPEHVKSFKKLVSEKFYDGTRFHRCIPGFMIQGGDPQGTGMGGPGYTIEDEFLDDLRFDGEGILAMANTGMPHTGGSQFFITLDKTPWLNGHHTIFGKVKEGMDVVRRIGHSETDMADRPLEDVVIKTIEIKYPE